MFKQRERNQCMSERWGKLEGGRGEGQPLVELCTKTVGGWGVFFFFLLTEGGWRKGKEGGVLPPDVRQRVEKQCVPKRCLHLECESAAPLRRTETTLVRNDWWGQQGSKYHPLLKIKIRINVPF